MGVKNLWDILESCKQTLPLHHLQNKRICVDLSCWVVQLQNVNRSYCAMKEKVYLRALFHRLRALISLNCSLIFVTDGAIPAVKISTYRRRLNSDNGAIVDANNPCKLSPIKRNLGSEFSRMIKEAKVLGTALGIPCLNGIEEAESQCALLNLESLCDGCFTSDSDAFLFGARKVYRDICLGEGGYVVCYEMDDIERKLGFGRNSLISLAILLGSDYTQGVRGFGPESASLFVKSIGDSDVLQRFASEGLSIVKKKSRNKGQNFACKGLEKDSNGHGCSLTSGNPLLQLIDAYMKPKCHSVKSDDVLRVLAVYPFSRNKLHEICTQLFDWTPEKTDEYILPKIAERDLRRYANLRSTSSILEVHLPYNQMPVKCPVSSIVKQRKSHGKDYFEVSWEDMYGLTASVVPADLVESACPEKILEFQQRKALKKKPKNRLKLKRVTKSAEMKDVGNKMHDLMLDIEWEQETTDTNDTFTRGLVPEMATMPAYVDLIDQSSNTETSFRGAVGKGSSNSVGFNSGSSTYVNLIDQISTTELNIRGGISNGVSSVGIHETEIIDLMSPSPPTHKHGVLKYEEVNCIDIIELSESDNDVSPEHARRARELRMFLASIRD